MLLTDLDKGTKPGEVCCCNVCVSGLDGREGRRCCSGSMALLKQKCSARRTAQ